MKKLNKSSISYLKIILIIFIIIIVSGMIISTLNEFSVNKMDCIQLLTTIIQSLASILAILISLTLVAVQLTAQNYSKRILKRFISYQNWIYWITIILYLITIIYGIFLIQTIPLNSTISNLDLIKVNFFVLLAIWALILLPFYIKYTLNELGPKRIIEELSSELNKTYMKNLTEHEFNLEEDPLTPIIDIIIHSVKIGDSESIKISFMQIDKHITNLIRSGSIKDPGFSIYLLNNLDKIKNVALINSDIKTLGLVIDLMMSVVKPILYDKKAIDKFFILFNTISINIIETESFDEVEKLIKNLKNFPLEWYFIQNYGVMRLLHEILVKYIEKLETKKYSNKIWIESPIEDSWISTKIIPTINEMRVEIAISGKEYEIIEEIKFLLNLGVNLSKYNPNQLFGVIIALNIIFKAYYKKGRKENPITEAKEDRIQNIIVNAIKFIGQSTIENDTYETTKRQLFDLDSIMPGVMIREDEVIITEIISSLKEIGLFYLSSEDLDEIKLENVIESLELISIDLAIKESTYVNETLDALGSIITENPKLEISLKKRIIEAYELIAFKLIKMGLIPQNNHLLQNLDKIIIFSDTNNDFELIEQINTVLFHIGNKMINSENQNGNLELLFTLMKNNAIVYIKKDKDSMKILKKMELILIEIKNMKLKIDKHYYETLNDIKVVTKNNNVLSFLENLENKVK